MQVLFRADLVYETLYNPGAARRGGRRGRRALGDGAIRGREEGRTRISVARRASDRALKECIRGKEHR
jgi:hypothetical protein